MSDVKNPESARQMSDLIESRERRHRQANRRRKRDPHGLGLWRGFAMFGRIGWTVAVPTLIGAALGAWLDSLLMPKESWILVFLLAGIGLGCINACRWLASEHHRLIANGDLPESARSNGAPSKGDADLRSGGKP